MKVAVAGALGRMGRTLLEAVSADRSLTLVLALDVADEPASGVTSDPAALAQADVLIEFTRPEATLAHLGLCKACVIGTTGFSDAQKKAIQEAARRIPIVMSPNFAVGVNVVFGLAESAARALGEAYDVEIIEAHHRQKIDAPSGTALELGRIVAKTLNRSLSEVAQHGRSGEPGARPAGQIGFHAIRGGDIVGEHTVLFAGSGERVEVTVRSQSRMTYAAGALRAAKWLKNRPPGLYGMAEVLGLK